MIEENLKEIMQEIEDRVISFYLDIKGKDKDSLVELNKKYYDIEYNPYNHTRPVNFYHDMFISDGPHICGGTFKPCRLDQPKYRKYRARIIATVLNRIEKKIGESIDQMIENSAHSCLRLYPSAERRLRDIGNIPSPMQDNDVIYRFPRTELDNIFRILSDIKHSRMNVTYSQFRLSSGFRPTNYLPNNREEERAERFLYSKNSPKAQKEELNRLQHRQIGGWYRVHIKEGNIDKNWRRDYHQALWS